MSILTMTSIMTQEVQPLKVPSDSQQDVTTSQDQYLSAPCHDAVSQQQVDLSIHSSRTVSSTTCPYPCSPAMKIRDQRIAKFCRKHRLEQFPFLDHSLHDQPPMRILVMPSGPSLAPCIVLSPVEDQPVEPTTLASPGSLSPPDRHARFMVTRKPLGHPRSKGKKPRCSKDKGSTGKLLESSRYEVYVKKEKYSTFTSKQWGWGRMRRIFRRSA